jgi:hypothetical protein
MRTLDHFPKPSRGENNLVGTAGEYYVCAELCRRGYLALLTPKNNPLFDVVATNPDGTRAVSIQVKTRSVQNKQGWKLGSPSDPAATPGMTFVVLVNLLDDRLPDFYIYRYPEFAARVTDVFQAYITKPKRSGEARKDPGFRWFDEVNFTDGDRSRRNNWEPILAALRGSLDQPEEKRGSRVDFG